MAGLLPSLPSLTARPLLLPMHTAPGAFHSLNFCFSMAKPMAQAASQLLLKKSSCLVQCEPCYGSVDVHQVQEIPQSGTKTGKGARAFIQRLRLTLVQSETDSVLSSVWVIQEFSTCGYFYVLVRAVKTWMSFSAASNPNTIPATEMCLLLNASSQAAKLALSELALWRCQILPECTCQIRYRLCITCAGICVLLS